MVKHKTKNSLTDSNLFIYLILALISFAVYANSLGNQFVFDDESMVLGDPTIKNLSSIPRYFTGEMGFHKLIGAYFRPVVSASYAVDYSVWNYNPFGYHLTNVIIHIICVLLLYLLLIKMFSAYESKYKSYAIILGAALFAVHPVHTEVVSWVSGRTDGLACLFFLLSFLLYLNYSKSKKPRDLVLLGLCYVLSLFSKEMAITFPAAVLLYELLVKKESISHTLKTKLMPFAILIVISVLYLVFRSYVMSSSPPRQSYDYFFGKDSATAFFTMIQVVPLYVRLLILPYGLLYHYSGYMPDISSPFDTGALIAILLLVLLFWVVFRFRKSIPMVSFGILLLLVSLLPVLNIIPTPNFMAERFLYIPSLALTLIVCALLMKLPGAKYAKPIISAAVLCIVILGYMTVSRNIDWKTNDSLFRSAEGKQGVVTYVNLGNMYARNGNIETAELYFRKAIDLRPETVVANNNLGKVFMVKGNFDSAYYYMNKARLLDTLSSEPVSSIAELHEKSRKLPESVTWLEKLNRMAPDYLNARNRLEQSKLLLAKQDSIKSYGLKNSSDSTALNSSLIDDMEKLSGISYNKKDYKKAIEQMNKLISINPSRTAVYLSNIGMCYMEQNKLEDATQNFRLSIKFDPKFSTAYNNLGFAYEKSGDKQNALINYQKAVELDPGNQLAKQRLSALSK